MDEIIFEDIMSPGVQLSNCIEFSGIKKYYPEYLQVEKMVNLSISDKLDPSNLPRKSALVYKPKSRIISTQNVRTLEPPVCQEIIGPAQ